MPVVNLADLPFDALGTNYLVIAMPHFTFNRVSAWITVMITLERCLCIIAPLQVSSERSCSKIMLQKTQSIIGKQ